MQTTITEALAEIATIDKRLPKKASDLIPYVARVEQVKDPMEKSGGSAKYLAEQRQSFADLLQRKVALRAAIAKANAETSISIAGKEMTVADWLVWKRECHAPLQNMRRGLLSQAQGARAAAQQQGVSLVTVGEGKADDIVVNLDEGQLLKEIDEAEEQFGLLDGRLSLMNATTFIEV